MCRMWPSKRFQDFQTSLFGNSGVVGGTDGQMDGQTDGRTDGQTDRQTQRLVEAPSRSLKRGYFPNNPLVYVLRSK